MVNAYIVTINGEINFIMPTYAGYKISGISKNARITLPRFASNLEVALYQAAPTREAVIFSPTEWKECPHLPLLEGRNCIGSTFYGEPLTVSASVWNHYYGGSAAFSLQIKEGRVISFIDDGGHNTNFIWDELPNIKEGMTSEETYHSLMEWSKYVLKYARIDF